MYDTCPGCGEQKIKEVYVGWDPTEFCTEKNIYVCVNCGWTVKKIVDHLKLDKSCIVINDGNVKLDF